MKDEGHMRSMGRVERGGAGGGQMKGVGPFNNILIVIYEVSWDPFLNIDEFSWDPFLNIDEVS